MMRKEEIVIGLALRPRGALPLCCSFAVAGGPEICNKADEKIQEIKNVM